MSVAVKSNKKALIEDKIDQFCQNSAELLSGIHERCSDLENGKSKKKAKRGRKKKIVD